VGECTISHPQDNRSSFPIAPPSTHCIFLLKWPSTLAVGREKRAVVFLGGGGLDGCGVRAWWGEGGGRGGGGSVAGGGGRGVVLVCVCVCVCVKVR